MISRNLNATCSPVFVFVFFSVPAGRLCVLDGTIKDKAFHFIEVYGPNVPSELPVFFQRIEPFVMGVKIKREKSVGLRLGSWKDCAFSSRVSWTDGLCKILDTWFGPDLQLEKYWSEVLEKVGAVIDL